MMMTVVVVLWLVRAFRQQDSISLYISLFLSILSLYYIAAAAAADKNT